jgi:hypothetical protein
MNRGRPTQAFAAREAHEALLELKKVVDEAAKTTHAAELESFAIAINQDETDGVRRTLQNVAIRLKSHDFDAVLSQARYKVEAAAAI